MSILKKSFSERLQSGTRNNTREEAEAMTHQHSANKSILARSSAVVCRRRSAGPQNFPTSWKVDEAHA